MHRNRKKRNIVIFSLVGVLFLMVAGYAAFSTNLEIKGTSKVTSNWDIEITGVKETAQNGLAENVKMYYEKLEASVEANLYDKGDSMEYDITIENKGNIDAKLNDILTNTENSNSEAVLITFSGYTKGEVLKSQTSKVIHVKIEYNPEYKGEPTSGEVDLKFDYVQDNKDPENPQSYLLTYDYSTNGGTRADTNEEFVYEGDNVSLGNIAYKEGWTFVGWNTNKDAQIGLENYQMPTSNTTLYAIYSKTLKVTYEKGENIDSIGKNEDSCNIYNNQTSCEVTLPEITVSDDSATVGWYNGEDKIGNPNDKYTITNDITLRAEAQFEPIMQSWSYNASTDFHNSTYRTNIITATFLDNKKVPEGATSWDVSSEKNGSVMAWVIPDETDSTKYHLYIGGEGGVIANKDSSNLFKNFTNLQKITFGDNFDTSNVTTMGSMFYDCSSLTTIDVSNWNTSNVTTMYQMFRDCSNLTTLDVSKWDTSNVTNMMIMFYDCSSLTTLDVSKWTTSNVKNMQSMFNGCSNLTTLDVSNWNTSNVTNMYSMFNSCSSLTTLDVSEWDTSKVTAMYQMFRDCSNLTTIDVSNWNTSNVTTMYQMFRDCSNLTTLDVSKWTTSNVKNMQSMFNGCSNLTTLDVSNWDTGNVTDMSYMFRNCGSLTKLVLCNWNTSKVTYMSRMFQDTTNLKSIYVGPNWTTANATTDDMFTGSGVSSVTQSNNCEIDAEDINLEISTTSTTNSITVVATAKADSGIAKYEYSKDGGKTWKESTNNTYIFTGLTAGTAYDIKVRVTSNIGKTLEKGKNVISLEDLVSTNTDELYTDEHGDIRYYGSNPNNYVTFNNELWRIIGVIDGKIKIIKNDSLGNMQWNSSSSNNWNNASLKTYLNGEYYNSIESTSKGMISEETFYLGGATSSNYTTLTASGYYNAERDSSQVYSGNPASTTQHIGLMYPSDYGYAAGESCLSTTLYSYDSSCKNSDYLFSGVEEWLQAPLVNYSYQASNLTSSGRVDHNINYAVNNSFAVRPVLYLSSNVQITGGDGSQSNPFSLGNGTSTSTLEKPNFSETDTDNGKTVTITYPKGCGSSLTCSYQKDNGSIVNVTSSTVNVEFTESGSLVANVSDGTNNVNSSYTVTVIPYTPGPATSVITQLLSKKGNELYKDNHSNIRYYGSNPNNYVKFNNELWRIMGVIDGKTKIINDQSIPNVVWAGGRRNNWNNSGVKSYLNSTYYNTIDSSYKKMIAEATYYLGGPNSTNYKLLSSSDYYDIERNSTAIYAGNPSQVTQYIGLMYPSDFGYAGGNSCINSSLYNYSNSCQDKNYLNNNQLEWLITPNSDDYQYAMVLHGHVGIIDMDLVPTGSSIRPVLYLTDSTNIIDGTGSSSNPFILSQ